MAKKLDDAVVSFKDDGRFSAVEEKLNKTVTALPNISPVSVPDPATERRNSSLSMPVYVWDLLKDASHQSREPQNIFVMKALKAAGLPINEADLIDPRKVRHDR